MQGGFSSPMKPNRCLPIGLEISKGLRQSNL